MNESSERAGVAVQLVPAAGGTLVFSVIVVLIAASLAAILFVRLPARAAH